ncbi:hypothetical protein KC332_g17432 [Hortaea werneckii]|uniref:A to I editase domain-containing protein n=2 Tax=Hortaea werneckii TaxID=91943 RepID=A0A3M7I0G0_HORWE|nr:hypothetical protein KC358_g17605 [Hortaea werneckii]OTA25089.1 hypothetical protein BTJ68_13667 [Hortaea werneckii EXF-2000]KAI6792924.1 hypothetical protein KC350_g17481 [Hortaea werneckii]KAI6898156.1 hypothetical protein KC348_g17535 [Hortaea werneckii]KAI6919028.1 hypothetical protein KC341_g17568 [Hortaea werneckii]
MPPHADAVADCVLSAFHALPTKCKPRRLGDSRREWVPLAGIVLSKAPPKPDTVHDDPPSHPLTCAALATGMKCLPHAKLQSAKGYILHDWHAEVLALRAFNRFLLDECSDLAKRGLGSEGAWVKWRRRVREEEPVRDFNASSSGRSDGIAGQGNEGSPRQEQPFELHDDVRIDMYVSDAPCGDASMELVMREQEDDTPWEKAEDGMPGRGNFDRLGVVRRKPARPDAPSTLSKSCSDKLAMKQCTSLLSGLTTLLIKPERCYLRQLILPQDRLVATSIERAFSPNGRMASLASSTDRQQQTWQSAGYSLNFFDVAPTSRRFEYEKADGTTASNISALSTPHRQETLVNGVLQGRKQSDPKGASTVSRRKMWEEVATLAAAVGNTEGLVKHGVLDSSSYASLKAGAVLEARSGVKRLVREEALKGWQRNYGDEEWNLV